MIINPLTPTALPIQLAIFEAKLVAENHALLNWETMHETNLKGFGVERSTDSRNWESIGFVGSKSDNGNSNTSLNYELVDNKTINGTNLYRLKIENLDGSFEYSPIRFVIVEGNQSITIYPNPAQSVLNIKATNDQNIIGLQILDNAGRTLQSIKGYVNIIQTENLSNGNYILRIVNKDGQINHIQFTISK